MSVLPWIPPDGLLRSWRCSWGFELFDLKMAPLFSHDNNKNNTHLRIYLLLGLAASKNFNVFQHQISVDNMTEIKDRGRINEEDETSRPLAIKQTNLLLYGSFG